MRSKNNAFLLASKKVFLIVQEQRFFCYTKANEQNGGFCIVAKSTGNTAVQIWIQSVSPGSGGDYPKNNGWQRYTWDYANRWGEIGLLPNSRNVNAVRCECCFCTNIIKEGSGRCA